MEKIKVHEKGEKIDEKKKELRREKTHLTLREKNL